MSTRRDADWSIGSTKLVDLVAVQNLDEMATQVSNGGSFLTIDLSEQSYDNSKQDMIPDADKAPCDQARIVTSKTMIRPRT